MEDGANQYKTDYILLTGEVDLNYLQTPGNYLIGVNNMVNKPASIFGMCFLSVYKVPGSFLQRLMCINNTNVKIYYRIILKAGPLYEWVTV